MNEIRRAGLEQLSAMVRMLLEQTTAILDAERQDVQDLPDNIEESDFSERVLKRPMFDLATARVCLVEAQEHILAATEKRGE
jgi:flagellar biosynthesis regulator FlaF